MSSLDGRLDRIDQSFKISAPLPLQLLYTLLSGRMLFACDPPKRSLNSIYEYIFCSILANCDTKRNQIKIF